MNRLIDAGLEQLSKLIFKMGDLAERTVLLSFDGFLKGLDIHEKVQRWSDILIVLNGEVEEKAIELIARHQPVASDLRTLTSYMKIAYDFSRYGRYARDVTLVCERFNINYKNCPLPWLPLRKMVRKVSEVVHTSIEAVKKRDPDLAKKIGKIESETDKYYFGCLDKLIEHAPIENRCVVANLLFFRHLERIADHAAYVGESVVYMVTGERISLR